VRKNAFRTKA